MTSPSWRKPFGAFLIIAIIIVWAGLVLMVSPWIERMPALVQAIIYILAGLAWILPLKPLLAWMERGAQSDRQR